MSLMALAVVCPGGLDGQELVGRIVDARSGRPVPSATIRLHRTEAWKPLLWKPGLDRAASMRQASTGECNTR